MAILTPVSTALVSTVWFALILLVVSTPPDTPKVQQFEAAFQGREDPGCILYVLYCLYVSV